MNEFHVIDCSNEHHDAVVKCILIINEEQESIPVGCASSTAVAVGEGRGCASRGVCFPGCVCASGRGVLPGGCASGGCIPACTRQTPPPLGTESQTTTTVRAVKI